MPQKKKSLPWLLIGGLAAGFWYFFGGSASASTTITLSPGAQKYMTQLMAAQNSFQAGSMSQTAYAAAATAILAAAAIDPSCNGQDLVALHGVAGV